MTFLRVICIFLVSANALAQSTNTAIIVFTSDRPDSISVKFHRNPVFDETTHGDGYKRVHTSEQPVKVRYEKLNMTGRISISSYSWPGNFIATNWIVEPGDSVQIYIEFGNGTPSVKCNGRGSTKYQLAFDSRHLTEGIYATEFEVYDKVKTHEQAHNEVSELEKMYLGIITASKRQLSRQVYQIWMADIQATAALTRLHIYSHQWTQNSNLRNEIRNELLNSQPSSNPLVWFNSRAFVQYQTELIKWNLLQKRDPNYAHNELMYIQKYTVKDLFVEFMKLPKGLRQVFMMHTLMNFSALAFTYKETHPELIIACLEMADKVVTDTILIKMLQKVKAKIKPGVFIDDFITFTNTGDLLKLSDFYGKKVLIDLWGPRCTGCLDFRNDLVDHVLPNIKGRNDIVIWSVGSAWTQDEWESYLNRYCHPEFTASWLKRTETDNEWELKYSFGYAPFIMLVDEKGNLISSTVRSPETILSLLTKTK